MQEKHLFDYAIIRVVPRVEREEFINVGVILYCPKSKQLHSAIRLDEARLRAVFPDVDLEDIRQHLNAFQRISEGTEGAGPIGEMDTASRFRWLTAKRSTMIQTSAVHPAFCRNLTEKLEQLMREQV